MKKLITIIILFAVVGYLHVETIYSFSGQPPAEKTGASNGSGTCTGCHNEFAVNIGVGSVEILMNDSLSAYQLDSTYSVKVKVKDTGFDKYGFELTALDSANDMIGSFTILNSSTTAITSTGGIDYVSHKNAAAVSDSNEWTFQWTADSSYQGTITFYAAGLSANNNSNTAGDYVYTTTKAITASTLVGVDEVTAQPEMRCYQNAGNLILEMNLTIRQNPGVSMQIFDMQGRVVYNNVLGMDLASQIVIPLSNKINSGTYIVRVINGQNSFAQKVILN